MEHLQVKWIHGNHRAVMCVCMLSMQVGNLIYCRWLGQTSNVKGFCLWYKGHHVIKDVFDQKLIGLAGKGRVTEVHPCAAGEVAVEHAEGHVNEIKLAASSGKKGDLFGNKCHNLWLLRSPLKATRGTLCAPLTPLPSPETIGAHEELAAGLCSSSPSSSWWLGLSHPMDLWACPKKCPSFRLPEKLSGSSWGL